MHVFIPPPPFRSIMAWTCSASTHNALITNLVTTRILTNPITEATLRAIDRSPFVPAPYPPYEDSPQPLICSATISAPHMHALALQHLTPHLKPGAHALDVGLGSGYFAALMKHMVGDGVVVGVEHVPELVEMATGNLEGVVIKEGDGRLGCEQYAPYDAIHVGAAAENVPEELLRQLKPGGGMIIPVGGVGGQRLLMITKEEGGVKEEVVCGVRYVPLCDLAKQVG